MEFVFERVLNALPASMVLVALAAVLLRFARGLNAATRHAAWWIVLLLVLALPFRPDFERLPGIELTGSEAEVVRAPIEVDTAEQEVALQWLTAAALGVSGLLLLRLLLHFVGLHLMKWRAARLDNTRLNEWRRRGFVWRRVMLRESARVSAPLVCGYLFPAVVLPKEFAARTDAGDLDHVLLHELGHVARFDDFTQLLTRVIQALAWWHPLVHVCLWRIDAEREAACDDWAVAVTGAPQGYAACLTRLMEQRLAAEESTLAPGIGGRRSQFSRRIERLMDPLRNPRPRFAFGALGAAIALLTAITLGATRLPALAVFEEGKKADGPARPGFLEGLARAGYRNLSVDQIIHLKHQGVTGRFAAEASTAFGGVLKPEDLLVLRQRGVSAAQIQSARKYGERLTIEQILRLKDAGVL